MDYSPKLKPVMEKIIAILKENDIAGIVILHTIEGTPTHKNGEAAVQGMSEYLMHINTSYSAASFSPITNRFQVLGKLEHYKSVQEKDIKLAGAVNMLENLGRLSGEMCLQITNMIQQMKPMIAEKRTTGGKHTSNEEQNN